MPETALKPVSIYGLTEDILALDELLNNLPDDPELQNEEIKAWLGIDASVREAVDAKLTGIVRYQHYLAALEQVAEAESKRIAAIKTTAANRRKNIGDRVKDFMLVCSVRFQHGDSGLPKWDSPTGKCWVQRNGGVAPLLLREGLTVDKVPEKFRRQPPAEIDEAAIRAALDAGESLDFACYQDRGTHLRVK